MLPALWLLPALVLSQSAPLPTAKPRPFWLETAQKHVKECTVRISTEGDSLLLETPVEPVFHHVQSVRAKAVGSLFLWTEKSGRPAAIADVFFLPAKPYTLYNEWHSLAARPVAVQWDGRTQLACPGPGLTWKEVPDAERPADTEALRSRQARQISRRFTARLVDRRGDKYELHLPATPLHQYHDANSDSHAADEPAFMSGALFVMCQQTDPEILLLVESRPAREGAKWYYALAAFSNLDLYVQLDEKEVWSQTPPAFGQNSPHSGGPLMSVELPPENPTPKSNSSR